MTTQSDTPRTFWDTDKPQTPDEAFQLLRFGQIQPDCDGHNVDAYARTERRMLNSADVLESECKTLRAAASEHAHKRHCAELEAAQLRANNERLQSAATLACQALHKTDVAAEKLRADRDALAVALHMAQNYISDNQIRHSLMMDLKTTLGEYISIALREHGGEA